MLLLAPNGGGFHFDSFASSYISCGVNAVLVALRVMELQVAMVAFASSFYVAD